LALKLLFVTLNKGVAMKRTFSSEDVRKDKLFDSWNEYLDCLQKNMDFGNCDETICDIAVVKEVFETEIVLRFEETHKTLKLFVPALVLKHCEKLDNINLTVARKGETWWPIDLITIGSIVQGKKSGIHFSVNPRYFKQKMGFGEQLH